MRVSAETVSRGVALVVCAAVGGALAASAGPAAGTAAGVAAGMPYLWGLLRSIPDAAVSNFAHELLDTFRASCCSRITRSPGPAKNHDLNDLAAAAIINALAACRDTLSLTNRWRPTVKRMAKATVGQVREVLDALPSSVLTEEAILEVLGTPVGGATTVMAIPAFWVEVTTQLCKVTTPKGEVLEQPGINHVARHLHTWFATEANELVRGDSPIGTRARHAANFTLLRAILDRVSVLVHSVDRLSPEHLRQCIHEGVTEALTDLQYDMDRRPAWFQGEFVAFTESIKDSALTIADKLEALTMDVLEVKIDTAAIRDGINGVAQRQAQSHALQRTTHDNVKAIGDTVTRIERMVTAHGAHQAAGAFASSKNFVPNFDGSALPYVLHNSLPAPISSTAGDHFGRESQISLVDEQIRLKAILPVVGPAACGKKYIIANALRQFGRRVAPQMPLAALALDLSPFPDHHLLRSAQRELRLEGHDQWFREVAGRDGELAYLRARFHEALQDLHEYSLIAVLCGADEAFQTAESQKELDEFFRLSTFNRGCGILTAKTDLNEVLGSNRVNMLGDRLVLDAVRVPEISAAVAVRIIAQHTGDTAIAQQVVTHLGEAFTFRPATIAEHTEFAVQKLLRDGRPLDPVELAFLIAECSWASWIEGLPSEERGLYSTLVIDEGHLTPLATLCLLAILKGIPVSSETLSRANLPAPKFPDWATELVTMGNRSATSISDLGRRVLLPRLANFSDDVELLTLGLTRLLADIGNAIDSDDAIAEFSHALEDSRTYLLRHVASPFALVQCLEPWIYQASVDSILRPEGLADSAAATDTSAVFGSSPLTAAISLAIRDHDANALEGILASVPMIENAGDITALTVRAYDHLLHQALQVFGHAGQIAVWRDAVADALLAEVARRPQDHYFRNWVLSWLTNTAWCALLAKDAQRCRHRLADARHLINTIGPEGDQFTAWVHLRVLQTEARMETSLSRRLHIHNEALQAALTGLRVSTHPAWWIPRVLNVARLYHRENLPSRVRGQSTRQIIEAVQSRLADLVSRRTEFTVELADTVRDSATRIQSQRGRVRMLRWALSLLRTDTTFNARRSPAHYVVTRIKVLQQLSRAVNRAAKPDDVKLRAIARRLRREADFLLSECLMRSDEELSLNIWRLLLRGGLFKEGRPRRWTVLDSWEAPTLPKLMKRAEMWAQRNRRQGRAVGRFMLELRQLKFALQGSCRTIAEKTAAAHQKSWDRLGASRKQHYLTRAFQERAAGLRHILRRYGPFPQIFNELAWQTCSYYRQMQLAVDPLKRRRMTRGERDAERSNQIEEVDAIFAEGKAACGRHPILLLEESRFRRYLHDFDSAIESAAALLDANTSGHSRHPDIRRTAATILAESSLTATIYQGDRFYTHDFRLANELPHYLEMAYKHLIADGCHTSGLVKYVVLISRLRLERGDDVDFQRIERLYSRYVGGLRRYYRRNEQELQLDCERDDPSADNADLASEWAKTPYHHQFLMAIGQLYLRRVQLGQSADRLADCYRAVSAFDTTYVIERDFAEARLKAANQRRLVRARPNVVCSFLLALSIYHAVTAHGGVMADPFSEPVPDVLRSLRNPPATWLDLAQRLFSSTAGVTTGHFSDLATLYMKECNRLSKGRGREV